MVKTSPRQDMKNDDSPADGADAAAPQPSQQALDRAQQEAEQTFRHANLDHPLMQSLQQLCIQRRARRLSGKN